MENETVGSNKFDSNLLVSEELKEIINYNPNWIIRNGNNLFFFVLLLVILISMNIQYPEVVSGHANIYCVNDSSLIYLPKQTSLDHFSVSERQNVLIGDTLATIIDKNNGDKSIIFSKDSGMVFKLDESKGRLEIKHNIPILVIRKKKKKYFGEGYFSAAIANKVKSGEEVVVKLDNYPAEKYGSLVGVTGRISEKDANTDSVSVQVFFPGGLITTYEKTIELKHSLTCQVQIITSKRSLFKVVISSLFN